MGSITLFLSRLKQKIDSFNDLQSYQNITKGICNHCNKGCEAYKFHSDNFPSLSLFFEEINGEVKDIYLCHALETETNDSNENDIYFKFYEEEKVGFKPSLDHLIRLQRVEKAVEEFNYLQSVGLIPLLEVIHWYNRMKNLANDLYLNEPYVSYEYRSYIHINHLYSEVSYLVHNYNEHHLIKSALDIYYKIDKEDEREIVKWLIENKDIYLFPLKKTENWENTGIFILDTNPNLIVDCIDFIDSYLFEEIYENQLDEIMKKYKPTKEYFDQNKDGVEYSLEVYLKSHQKYLDLL